MDLGECPKYYDLALKADYEMAAKDKDYYYDIDVSVTLVITGIFSKTTTSEIYFLALNYIIRVCVCIIIL